MKKTITKSGMNGTFTGSIDIKFNHRSENRTVHNPSTHEDDIKNVGIHIVTGQVGTETFKSKEFENENLVWQEIEDIENKVNSKLHQLANVPVKQNLTEQLKQKGFK